MTQINQPVAETFEVGGFMSGYVCDRQTFFYVIRRTAKSVWAFETKKEIEDGVEVPLPVRRSDFTEIEQFRVHKNGNGAEYIHRNKWLYITPYDGKPKSFTPL